MSNMDLFIQEPELHFERPKTASAQLSEDQNKWSQEILNELFKQVPEASEYTPAVSMMEVDEEQGYGLGTIIIRSGPDSAMSTGQNQANAGRKALVPVIIKQFMLMPLDILMMDSGRMTPLNGDRLREALFRPETFELMTTDWGDQSLYNMFYPPGRGSNDYASGVSTTASGTGANYIMGPGMKYSMLEDIGPTLNKADLKGLTHKIASNDALMATMRSNKSFRGALSKLGSYEESLLDDATGLFKTAEEAAPIHVVQMGYDPEESKYWVKKASRSFFHNKNVEFMDRGQFYKIAGPEVTAKVDTEGTVTMSDQAVEDSPMEQDASKWSIVEKPGVYKVMDVNGKEMTGWVIPNLLGLDGTRYPMAVFTNGVTASVQDEIAGSEVSKGVNLPQDDPMGTGVFYSTASGEIEATIPVAVVGSEEAVDGSDVFLVRTLLGEDYRVKMVPGLKKMVPSEESDEVLAPDTIKFLSLDEEAAVGLVDAPDGVNKTASALSSPSVTVFGDGYEYGLAFNNLPGIESVMPKKASKDEAVFALCAGGLSAKDAYGVIKQAESGARTVNLEDVRTARSVTESSMKVAEGLVQKTHGLRKDLIKEAAILPDIQTVDSVLSLQFINPENIRTFLSRLPYLEKSLHQICELTVAARLGMREIPEFAAARAARGLDEVIQGLKALSMKDVGEDQMEL